MNFFYSFAVMALLFNLSGARTGVAISSGQIKLETALGSEIFHEGDTVLIDRGGRMMRKDNERSKRRNGNVATLGVVADGSIRVNERIVNLGEEFYCGGTIGSSDVIVSPLGPQGFKLLKQFKIFIFSEKQKLLQGDDQARIIRLISRATENFEHLDVNSLLDLTTYSGKLSGRTFREYADILNEIVPHLRFAKITLALLDLESEVINNASARFVVSIDFYLNDLDKSVVNLAGSGRILFIKTDETWRISGGELTAFDVDSEKLPSIFVELRDTLMNAER